MLWSASAKTKNPEAAVAWINWFANTKEAVDIDKAERGHPAERRTGGVHQAQAAPAQQEVAKFITDIKPELANTPIAPPPGGGKLAEILFRYETEALRAGEHR